MIMPIKTAIGLSFLGPHTEKKMVLSNAESAGNGSNFSAICIVLMPKMSFRPSKPNMMPIIMMVNPMISVGMNRRKRAMNLEKSISVRPAIILKPATAAKPPECAAAIAGGMKIVVKEAGSKNPEPIPNFPYACNSEAIPSAIMAKLIYWSVSVGSAPEA